MNTYDIIFHAINRSGRRAGRLHYRRLKANSPAQAHIRFLDLTAHHRTPQVIVDVTPINPA